MALKYKQTFTVKGTLQFPIDMLRDDDCFPFDESDSGKIERAMDAGSDPWADALRRDEESPPDNRSVRSFSAEAVTESVETAKMPVGRVQTCTEKGANAMTVNVAGKELVIRLPISDPPEPSSPVIWL